MSRTSKSNTWMPLYIGDYLADTMHLNAAEHGAYLLLLMHYWRTGPLPDDDKALSGIARVDRKVWDREIGSVVRAFFTIENGQLHQKRLDAELATARAVADKKRAAAGQRWAKNGHASAGEEPPPTASTCNAYAAADAGASAEQMVSQRARASQSQSQKQKKDIPLATLAPSFRGGDGGDFEGFWNEYPRKIGKDAARRAYANALKRVSAGELLSGLRRQRWPADPQFVAHPATWLNQGRWQDDPAAAAPDRPKAWRDMTAAEKDADLMSR